MSKTFKIQITKKGTTQVTIPAFVAAQLDLKKGSIVEWYLDRDRVELRKVGG